MHHQWKPQGKHRWGHLGECRDRVAFAPPPGVATHAVEADEVLADYPDPNGLGGSSDPPQVRIAVAVPVESEEEESDEESEGGSGAVRDSEMAEVAEAEEATCGAAPGSGAVYIAVEVGAPSALLGSILGDETTSLQLAEAWEAYPQDLRVARSHTVLGPGR